MVSKGSQNHKLVIPSDLNELPDVEAFTEKLSIEAGFSEADRDSIAISVTELVANAISHGNKCDVNKVVNIEFTISPGEFIFVVQDQGDGFVPEEVADPLAPENLLKDSGRGIYIVRALMDEVEYKPTPNGTYVRIVKRPSKNDDPVC
jgi:serine/threonine-protein kinase RsbW